ncbi:MAG TPA: DUF6471 domain-containing protein [Rhizomicrobium sp.]|jgi:hypothetical protein|nr:DUF6471 domain-containing protein [Rhizomicrobium sp.]
MGRKNLPNPERRVKISPVASFPSEALEEAGGEIFMRPQGGPEPPRTTPAELAMQEIGKTILRMEMKRAGVSYAGLAERLVKMGMPENEPNVRNKVARGKFSMAYFLACLRALGTKTISVDIEVPRAEAILAEVESGKPG